MDIWKVILSEIVSTYLYPPYLYHNILQTLYTIYQKLGAIMSTF